MIYRVHFEDDADGSTGFDFTTSRREAERMLRDWRKDSPSTRACADIDSFPTPRTKAALLVLLKSVGSHPDNG